MKKLLTLIPILALCFSAVAQTNTQPFNTLTNVLPSSVTTTLGFLYDATPYITNGDSLWEAGALKSGSHYGGFLDVQFPVSTNSWQASYGVALAYVDHSFYSGALNVSLGTTVNVPGISKITGPFFAYVESGPGYNFRAHQFVVQSFAGIKWIHSFSPKWSVGASYGYGIISDVAPKQQEFGLSFTYKFGK